MRRKIFQYGSHSYEYFLEYSQRKSFSLIIFPNLRIMLKAPLDANGKDVEAFLIKKWSWMKKQLNEFERYKKPEFQKSYLSGESFYYLGRQYMLKVERSHQECVKISPGIVTLYTSKSSTDREHNQAIYSSWYINKCESIFKKELVGALQDCNIKIIPRLKIREMKSRWGSYCNNTISLNPKLLQASSNAIRYVITHELCHIENKSHDKHFYDLLESRMPDWKRIKEELEIKFG